jgi:hypothetical protein
VNISKKGDKSYCGNYGGISALSTRNTILSRSLKIKFICKRNCSVTQCRFQGNKSNTDRISHTKQVLNTNGSTIGHSDIQEYSGWMETMYEILVEFGITDKTVRLIKLCLTKERVATLYIRNGLNKQRLYRHCFSDLL